MSHSLSNSRPGFSVRPLRFRAGSLLSAADPAPFSCVNESGSAPLVLFCDHAGRSFPQSLGRLGLSTIDIDRHIAWDIGIAALGRQLAEGMAAPLMLSAYSRLVIDCNRRLNDPTSIAAESDGCPIPGNCGLSRAHRRQRALEIFIPYHKALRRLIAAQTERNRLFGVVSLHSFTPIMNGNRRPWHVGILWNNDGRLALPLMRRLSEIEGICVGDNEPYSGRDGHGYSITAHAEEKGLPHALIEIRQDLIDTEEGQQRWAALIGRALIRACVDMGFDWQGWQGHPFGL